MDDVTCELETKYGALAGISIPQPSRVGPAMDPPGVGLVFVQFASLGDAVRGPYLILFSCWYSSGPPWHRKRMRWPPRPVAISWSRMRSRTCWSQARLCACIGHAACIVGFKWRLTAAPLRCAGEGAGRAERPHLRRRQGAGVVLSGGALPEARLLILLLCLSPAFLVMLKPATTAPAEQTCNDWQAWGYSHVSISPGFYVGETASQGGSPSPTLA